MYLFFDTETTGLPKNYKAPVTDIINWPRMVQLAWQIYDIDGNLTDNQNFIIIPEGYKIPKASSDIHRITTKRAIEEGTDLLTVLDIFNYEISKADELIAHNMSFDEKIIGAEFIRKNIKSELFNKKRVCTMLSAVEFCEIPGRYGYKWPRLDELHMKLFGETFEEAHDAAADISATARCFWELRKLGVL